MLQVRASVCCHVGVWYGILHGYPWPWYGMLNPRPPRSGREATTYTILLFFGMDAKVKVFAFVFPHSFFLYMILNSYLRKYYEYEMSNISSIDEVLPHFLDNSLATTTGRRRDLPHFIFRSVRQPKSISKKIDLTSEPLGWLMYFVLGWATGPFLLLGPLVSSCFPVAVTHSLSSFLLQPPSCLSPRSYALQIRSLPSLSHRVGIHLCPAIVVPRLRAPALSTGSSSTLMPSPVASATVPPPELTRGIRGRSRYHSVLRIHLSPPPCSCIAPI